MRGLLKCIMAGVLIFSASAYSAYAAPSDYLAQTVTIPPIVTGGEMKDFLDIQDGVLEEGTFFVAAKGKKPKAPKVRKCNKNDVNAIASALFRSLVAAYNARKVEYNTQLNKKVNDPSNRKFPLKDVYLSPVMGTVTGVGNKYTLMTDFGVKDPYMTEGKMFHPVGGSLITQKNTHTSNIQCVAYANFLQDIGLAVNALIQKKFNN